MARRTFNLSPATEEALRRIVSRSGRSLTETAERSIQILDILYKEFGADECITFIAGDGKERTVNFF